MLLIYAGSNNILLALKSYERWIVFFRVKINRTFIEFEYLQLLKVKERKHADIAEKKNNNRRKI